MQNQRVITENMNTVTFNVCLNFQTERLLQTENVRHDAIRVAFNCSFYAADGRNENIENLHFTIPYLASF